MNDNDTPAESDQIKEKLAHAQACIDLAKDIIADQGAIIKDQMVKLNAKRLSFASGVMMGTSIAVIIFAIVSLCEHCFCERTPREQLIENMRKAIQEFQQESWE